MIALAAAGAMLLAMLLAAAWTQVMRRVAVLTGFVAVPREDRHHRQPTPLLGGVAILLGILLPSLLALALAAAWNAQGVPAWLPPGLAIHLPGVVAKTGEALGILGGAVALHIVGLIDDRKRLGPWLKLAAQLAVAAGVVLVGGVRLMPHWGGGLSSVASIAWIVIVTNALNFLDNIDGLAAGVTAICAAALLAAAAAAGQLFVGAWLCLLLGASAGFLLLNFPPARIFMGDAGSLVLGYFLAVLSMLATYYTGGPGGQYYVYAPLVLLAVPLYDVVSVITLRLAERRNPMVGDTRHFSHRLLRRGMSPRKAVLTIYLATASTAIGASLLPHVRSAAGAVMLLAQAVAIVLLIALLESADRGKP